MVNMDGGAEAGAEPAEAPAEAQGGGDEPRLASSGSCPNLGGDTNALLSNELLDMLGPGGGGELMGNAGIGTPSEPGTPTRFPSRQTPVRNAGAVDPWDWKTDVPEFVPAGMVPSMPGMPITGFQALPLNGVNNVATTSIWTVPPSNNNTGMTWGPAAMPVSAQGGGALTSPRQDGAATNTASTGNEAEDLEIQALKERYEWQIQSQESELKVLHNRMAKLEQRRIELKESWHREKSGLTREISRYAAVLTRYAIPLEEACDGEVMAQPQQHQQQHQVQQPQQSQQQPQQPQKQQNSWASATASSLDAKMKRLNGLLSDGPPRKGSESGADPAAGGASQGGSAASRAGAGKAGGQQQEGDGSFGIASTLQAMFPHATVRTQPEDGDCADDGAAGDADGEPRKKEGGSFEDAEVVALAEELEATTSSQIDDRALRALQNLPSVDAMEVLRKVEDLVRAQGGRCRNLSSILQSVCRKLERKSGGRGTKDGTGHDDEAGGGAAASAPSAPAIADGDGAGASAPQALKAADGGEPPDGVAEEGHAGDDDQDADEGDGNSWTARRVENAAARDFELRHVDGEDRWALRLAMANLEPQFTEEGMEHYCRWLRERLDSFRGEHGQAPLRKCCGEIDFSNNGLSNQAVWMLLETLAHFEVHAALIKLQNNNISQGGVLALCEFIRTNRRAGPVHELHLSHNEVDDESALELLRTLRSQKSRYPPKRAPTSGSSATPVSVPVLVALNHNSIQDPQAALRALDAEGVTYCSSRVNTCPPGRGDCPLLNLYEFTEQGQAAGRSDSRREEEQEAAGESRADAAAEPEREERHREVDRERNARWGIKGEGRPGDWDCPECGARVFASKSACFKCGYRKDGTSDPKNFDDALYGDDPSGAKRKRNRKAKNREGDKVLHQ